MFQRIVPTAIRRYACGSTGRRQSVIGAVNASEVVPTVQDVQNTPPVATPGADSRAPDPAASSGGIEVDDYRLYRMQQVSADPLVVESRPANNYPFVHMTVSRGGRSTTELMYTSHLCLAKLLIEYEFDTVLDIGSGQGAATRLFRQAGKHVSAVDILDGMGADYVGDYLKLDFSGRQWDVVWCSHILEHIRNVGAFLDKIWDELRDGGILALTVPNQAYHSLILGHCNLFNTGLLLYHLVCAGFDCRLAVAKCYDYNLSVIVRKSSNGIARSSFASVPFEAPSGGTAPGHGQDVCRYFPFACTDYMPSEIDSIGWDATSRKTRI